MYCIKCGTKLPEEARYCVKCGFPVPELLLKQNSEEEIIQEEPKAQDMDPNDNIDPMSNLSTEVSAATEPTEDSHSKIKEYIGTNADYYIKKWNRTPTPGRAVSWNWAAFFLTGYWLSYRKMYLYTLIWFLITYGCSLPIFFIGFDHLGWSILFDCIAFGISFALGMFGNAIYYQHAQKKLQKWEQDTTLQSKTTLSKMGGTGWLGTVLLIIAHLLIVVISTILVLTSVVHSGYFNDMNSAEDMVFGTGANNYGVTGVQDQFHPDSSIYLEAHFNRPAGTDQITVMFVKQGDGGETIVGKWHQNIDPSWDSIYFKINDPVIGGSLDPGHYIVRLYDSQDLLSEGEFDISTSIIEDNGSNRFEL
ncbi:MAG: DUF2628 domain-containing protein [Tuberibacillus sp.]